MFCRDKVATAVATALHGYDYPALREDRTPLFFKPTDIHSIGFLRFRLFFRMIY